jgi:hypothetical protein
MLTISCVLRAFLGGVLRLLQQTFKRAIYQALPAFMKHTRLFLLTSIIICTPAARAQTDAPAVSIAAVPTASATPSDRLDAIEKRLALIDKKFALLAATDEGDLNNSGQVFESPGLLLTQAEHAITKEKKLEKAYRYLTAIHALYPQSPEDSKAYAYAAGIFKRQYFRTRHTEPDSVWLKTEPVFLFHWLATFFSENRFPQKEVEDLLIGMPMSFLEEFNAYLSLNPRLSPWMIAAEEDNGRIEGIRASNPAALKPTK